MATEEEKSKLVLPSESCNLAPIKPYKLKSVGVGVFY